jgi:hypothetical protein
MDSSIAAYVSLGLSIGAAILGIINHKRIRSTCCGKEASVSLDIENTTPKREAFVECPTKLSPSEEATKSRRTSLAEPSTSASPP